MAALAGPFSYTPCVAKCMSIYIPYYGAKGSSLHRQSQKHSIRPRTTKLEPSDCSECTVDLPCLAPAVVVGITGRVAAAAARSRRNSKESHHALSLCLVGLIVMCTHTSCYNVLTIRCGCSGRRLGTM